MGPRNENHASLSEPRARGRVPGRGEGLIRRCTLTTALLLLTTPATAHAHARPWPAWWYRQAICIHQHESVDWHRRWTDWQGRPSRYAGGMQFTEQAWLSVGGRGEPWQWPPREQLYRSWLLWKLSGGSWSAWGTARLCGLR